MNSPILTRLLCFVALLAGLCHGASTLAHAIVVDASPPDRSVLTRVPAEVVLRFNAKLEKKLTHVKLDRADGSTQTLKDIAQEPAIIRAILPPDLHDGAYTLHYKVLATDGHATQGVLRFTLQGLR
jgi:methionine-rich copper-binding protein CopC